jgi:hypothetical protein
LSPRGVDTGITDDAAGFDDLDLVDRRVATRSSSAACDHVVFPLPLLANTLRPNCSRRDAAELVETVADRGIAGDLRGDDII